MVTPFQPFPGQRHQSRHIGDVEVRRLLGGGPESRRGQTAPECRLHDEEETRGLLDIGDARLFQGVDELLPRMGEVLDLPQQLVGMKTENTQERDQAVVGIVEDFDFGSWLAEENRTSPTKRFDIGGMFGKALDDGGGKF